MAKLTFDGERPEYHPATGLDLLPGENDYPDEHVECLVATGRFKGHKPKKTSVKEKE